jgi:hypothetical protein
MRKATISQGKEKARERRGSIVSHPAFGMWKDRADMKNVRAYLRQLRKSAADPELKIPQAR